MSEPAAEADAFERYLEERFQGELYGEVMFAVLADAASDAVERYKWRVLEALERETKALLANALRARGRPAVESAEVRAQGEKLGRRLAPLPFAALMKGFRPELARFVEEYASAERGAPADGMALARHITAHERALLEFTDLELAGEGARSAAVVIALLADPPAPVA